MRPSSAVSQGKALFATTPAIYSLQISHNTGRLAGVPELTTCFLAKIAASAAESTLGSDLEDVKPHLALPLQPSLLLLVLIFLARAACAEGRGTKCSAF